MIINKLKWTKLKSTAIAGQMTMAFIVEQTIQNTLKYVTDCDKFRIDKSFNVVGRGSWVLSWGDNYRYNSRFKSLKEAKLQAEIINSES